jgi:hypothetical protein
VPIAAIPPAERNWEHVVNALGYALDELDQRRAAIEDDIRFLANPPEPPSRLPDWPEPTF